MPQNRTDSKQTTELLRYAICTGIVSIGMSFNTYSPAALMNMHSARMILTVKEAKDKYAYSGMDIPQAISAASSLISSASILVSGYSKLSCFLESTHLCMNMVSFAERWFRIRRVLRSSQNKKASDELRRMDRKASFDLACAFIEFASFTFKVWPVYFSVNAVKGIYFVYCAISEDRTYSIGSLYSAFTKYICDSLQQ